MANLTRHHINDNVCIRDFKKEDDYVSCCFFFTLFRFRKRKKKNEEKKIVHVYEKNLSLREGNYLVLGK